MPPDPSWAPNTSKIDNLSPEEVEELLRSWREAVAEGERLDAEGKVEGGITIHAPAPRPPATEVECPACRTVMVPLPVVYGYPGDDRLLSDPSVIVGGCCVGPGISDATHHCRACAGRFADRLRRAPHPGDALVSAHLTFDGGNEEQEPCHRGAIAGGRHEIEAPQVIRSAARFVARESVAVGQTDQRFVQLPSLTERLEERHRLLEEGDGASGILAGDASCQAQRPICACAPAPIVQPFRKRQALTEQVLRPVEVLQIALNPAPHQCEAQVVQCPDPVGRLVVGGKECEPFLVVTTGSHEVAVPPGKPPGGRQRSCSRFPRRTWQREDLVERLAALPERAALVPEAPQCGGHPQAQIGFAALDRPVDGTTQIRQLHLTAVEP